MKAVLVIDVTKCGGCPFCHNNAYYSWCDAPRKERSWEMPLTSKDIEEERTVECPLRLLPERWNGEMENIHPLSIYSQGMRDGFNMCLEEIVGETE